MTTTFACFCTHLNICPYLLVKHRSLMYDKHPPLARPAIINTLHAQTETPDTPASLQLTATRCSLAHTQIHTTHSILGMNLFGCKFCFKQQHDDVIQCDRKNFDSLLWALVTVFQVCLSSSFIPYMRGEIEMECRLR